MSVLTAKPRRGSFDPLRDKSYRQTALGGDIVDFLAWCELGGMSPKTLINYEPDLARGALLFPDKAILDITGGDLLHIARAFPPASRRTRMAAWRSFYKWARRTRRVTVNPCEELPDIKKPSARVIPVFTEAEAEALLALPVRDAAPLAVLLEAGLRRAEACALRFGSCRPEDGRVVVLNGKGRRQRVIPMSPRLVGLLDQLDTFEGGLDDLDHVFYAVKANQAGEARVMRRFFDPAGGPRPSGCGEATFSRWWRRCLDTAGIRYRTPHTARHTFATRWRQRGLAIDDISMLLGHAHVAITEQIYVHTTVDDITDRMRAIELAESRP